jgi:endoglucanase
MLNSVFDIRSFSAAASTLQLNGRAAIANDALQLTPNSSNQVGSAFYRNSIAIEANTSFSSSFQFRIGGGQGTRGADGFTFILQNTTAAERSIGGAGGSLGYGGMRGKSIAIEFDTYKGTSDPNNNHIAIQRNGSVTSAIASANPTFDLNSNQLINVWLDYNGNNDKLDIFLSQTTVKPTAVSLSATIDLFAALGSRAFVGFGAGTGGLWNTHTITSWQLSTGTTATSPPVAKFNYAEALQKSIYFYDAQRSGDLPDNFRVEWRGDSTLDDGSDVGRDLTGGWFDAGDTIKFSRTIGYTAAMLSWSWLETPQAFSSTGQNALFLDSLKWGTDYLLKAFTNDQAGQYEFYSQVGSMGSGVRDDHSNWVAAEVIHEVTDRPSYKITTATPSSDIAGQGAAGLASASIVFRNSGNTAYADLLLSKAEKLFDFANGYRGMGKEVAPNGTVVNQSPYTDITFFDELLWSATWVHKAKLASNANYGNSYLTLAESIFNEAGAQSIRGNYESQQSWQSVDHGAEILLVELTNKAVYRQEVENTLDWWTIGYNNSRVSYTPGGLAWRYEWGPLRYAATQSFMALVYNETITDTTKQTRYRNFAERQINYMLGDNPTQRSYMIGFGTNPVRTPHHRTAYGPWVGWENYNKGGSMYQPLPRHTIYGAIVGGPNLQDQFTEDATNYVTNEVAIDYNAGLTGALAKLVQSYGGTPLSNFPAPEQRDDQYFVEAGVNASGTNFTEIRTQLNNRSAWPARVSDRLSFRYYITLETGVSLSDLTVSRTGGVGTVSLKPYRDNIAYVEVDLTGIKIFPGGFVNGQASFRQETFFRVVSTKGWNAANDWSFDGLPSGSLTKRPRIAVYDNGLKVYGQEP